MGRKKIPNRQKNSKAKRACEICEESRTVENHHIVPRSQGGSDFGGNRLWICSTCHTLIHKGYIKILGWKNLGYKFELDYERLDVGNREIL